ncbi:hypothetical protein QJQ45_023990, partial [Haematococcus lacustris]
HAPPVLEPIGSGQNALSSVFTLCNSAIGAGVLSLPYAFRHAGKAAAVPLAVTSGRAVLMCALHARPTWHSPAGLVGGVVLCLTIGSAEGFTLYVLSKFAERYKADTYGQLVRRSLGRKLTALLAGIQVTYLFGACVVYLVGRSGAGEDRGAGYIQPLLQPSAAKETVAKQRLAHDSTCCVSKANIIMGDTFSSLGQLYLDPSNWLVQRDVIITGLGLGLLLPLCLLKKLGHLSSLSTLAVAGFMFTAGVVMYQGTRLVLQRPDHLEGVVWWKWDLGTLYAVPIITFGFNCHSNVVSIFRELTAEPDLLIASLPPSPSAYRTMPNFAPRPASHKLINMLGVIIGAMLVIQVGYICVGISGYLGYPHTVGSNILQSLPQDAVYAQVAQGLIGFVVLAHYPLSHFPARTGIHDVLHLLGFTQPLSWVYDLFTVLFVISSVAVARSVHSLGDALHLIGGTTASFMIFFLPGLMLINAAVMKRSNNLLDLISQDNGSPHAYNEPLLRLAANKGIKKTGLVYSPGKSWAAGIFLVALSLAILVLTVVTTLYKPHSENVSLTQGMQLSRGHPWVDTDMQMGVDYHAQSLAGQDAMAFVQLGGDESSRPTYFEVVAADRLVPSLKSALVYALSVLSQRRSWLHRLLTYEDEVLATLMLVVDWHSLSTVHATFAESLYGLRRKPINGIEDASQRPSRALELALQVVLPYLRTKCDRLHRLGSSQGMLGLALQRAQSRPARTPEGLFLRLRSMALRCFVASYPLGHAGIELLTFGYHLAYLLSACPAHRPVLHALGLQLARVSASDMSSMEQRKQAARKATLAATHRPGSPAAIGIVQRGALRAAYGVSDHYRNALIMAVFGFKALEWWFTSAEERLAAGKSLAPPSPPPPQQPSLRGVGLPLDPATCPVCRRPCVNPAQMATSGYVFCYPCVFAWVQEHGSCPVTLLPSGIEHVRKLYDDV